MVIRHTFFFTRNAAFYLDNKEFFTLWALSSVAVWAATSTAESQHEKWKIFRCIYLRMRAAVCHGCAPHASIHLKPALSNLDLTQLSLSGLGTAGLPRSRALCSNSLHGINRRVEKIRRGVCRRCPPASPAARANRFRQVRICKPHFLWSHLKKGGCVLSNFVLQLLWFIYLGHFWFWQEGHGNAKLTNSPLESQAD